MKKFNFVLTKKLNIIISTTFILIAVALTLVSGKDFYDFARYEQKFYVGSNVTRIEKFSDYSPKLKGTVGDADIFVLEGTNPGPSVLIIGGTHPNEPSSQLTSVLFLENLQVDAGTVYIITEANRSAFTHSHPQEGAPMFYSIDTPFGERVFKFGSRATNTSQQWPTPDIYVHRTSGQKLSALDTRNLNRAYPGVKNGNFTERVAYAITQLIIENDITITIDLHEASPEYLTNNAIVAHNRSINIASNAFLKMELQDVDIKVEISPANLHGLSHRELGDFTNTLVFLCETSNASQGKLRGRFTNDLIITGEDKYYKKAEELGLLYAPPVHIDERVARHTLTIVELINAYNDIYNKDNLPGESLLISGIPSYQDILNNGVGNYLHAIDE